MRVCQTLLDLLQAIKKSENCCAEYTHIQKIKNAYVINQADNTSLIVDSKCFSKIEPYLKRIVN